MEALKIITTISPVFLMNHLSLEGHLLVETTSLKGPSPFLLLFIFGFGCLSRRFSTCKWKQKHEKKVTDTM